MSGVKNRRRVEVLRICGELVWCLFVCLWVCAALSFPSMKRIQNYWVWLTQAILSLPFEKGRQCCPCPEQDISFESKNNRLWPSTRNRYYLKMYPLLWQPRENLFPHLPFDLSSSSFYCLPHFQTLNFSSLLQSPSDFPIPPFALFFLFHWQHPSLTPLTCFSEFKRLHSPHTTMSSLVFSDRDVLHVSIKSIRRWQWP